MDNTLELLLRYIDSMLNLNSIPTLIWLLFIAILFFIFTFSLEFLRKQNLQHYSNSINKDKITNILILALGFSSGFCLLAFIISYISGYYYNFYVVLGLIIQVICSCALSIFWLSPTQNKKWDFARKIIIHLNAIVFIFIVSARWIIRGVDAEETSADTLNIYYNGVFRYSLHAGWYDLAPVDSIIKVILLSICGNNDPFSPFESFLISFTLGLFLYIIVYAYVRNKHFLQHLAPLIPAILAIHPYAFLPGLYIPPTNVAVALALATLITSLLSSARNTSIAFIITPTLMFITSVLAHPFSLSALIFYIVCLIAKYLDKSLKRDEILILGTISIIWLVKTIYTATIHGILSIYETVVKGILTAWERESLIAFRNIGYAQAPRLALASFSAPLGIVGGITVTILPRAFSRKPKTDSRWIDLFIILFVGLTGLSSLLATLGGYSRYIFVPFASLFSLIFLLYSERINISNVLKITITLATIFTIITPNFMPDQYSFSMAAKITDRMMFEISRSLFEKLDPSFVINRFQGVSRIKLYIDQKGEFIRNAGEAGLIVDKLILNNIVKARSYWDFAGRGPFNAIEEEQNYSRVNIVIDSDIVRVISLWISP